MTTARAGIGAGLRHGDDAELPHGRMLLIGLAAFAVLVVLVAELLYYPGMARLHEDALLRVVVDAAVGGAYLAMGLITWSRRPDSRVGLLLYLSGLLFFAGNYSWANVPVVHQLAVALGDASVVLVGIAVLGYPSGRLREPASRLLAVVAAAWVLATGFLTATQLDPSRCDVRVACPSNPFRLDLGPAFAIALDQVGRAGAIVLWIAFLALVAARWWRATPAARRNLRPLWIAGILVAVSRVGEPVVHALLGPDAASLYVSWVSMPAVIGIPMALAYGLVKGRLEQAAVSDLVVRLRSPATDRPLASSIADALGDPGLTLAFPGPDGGLVDADGRGRIAADRFRVPGRKGRGVVRYADNRMRTLVAASGRAAAPAESGQSAIRASSLPSPSDTRCRVARTVIRQRLRRPIRPEGRNRRWNSSPRP